MRCPRKFCEHFAIAWALVVCACGSEPEHADPLVSAPDIEVVEVYESEFVRVLAEPLLPFCRGDGARMDAHLERLSDDLAVEAPEQVPVYLVRNSRGSAIADWCFGDHGTLGGCFQPWIVMAKAWAVPHELNHVVLHTLNPRASTASQFWSETYASAWETSESRYDPSDLAAQTRESAYEGGGHLLRWLSNEAGPAPVAEFFASIDTDWDADQAFEDGFGIAYAEALASHMDEQPPIYPGYRWCDDVEVIDVPLGVTEVTLTADCGAPDTYALAEPPIEGMYVRRVLRLPQRADLRIAYSSRTGVLNHHPCLETPVSSADDPRLSGDAWYRNIGTGVPPMGMLSTMDNIEAGDNLLEFVVPFGDAVEVQATITAESPAG